MRQSAIVLARAIGYIELADLLTGANTSVSEIVLRLTERYNFQKFPKTLEELDVKTGIEFLEGAIGQNPIKKFAIWNSILVMETRISTDASKVFLEELLDWGAKELGLNYKPGSIKRFAYISDVSFFSDAPILEGNSAINNLAAKCSSELSAIWQEPVKYEPFTVRVGHDPMSRKNGIAPFLIEHRAEANFSENKYFSEAPLPTDLHWKLLEEFEMDILLAQKSGNV